MKFLGTVYSNITLVPTHHVKIWLYQTWSFFHYKNHKDPSEKLFFGKKIAIAMVMTIFYVFFYEECNSCFRFYSSHLNFGVPDDGGLQYIELFFLLEILPIKSQKNEDLEKNTIFQPKSTVDSYMIYLRYLFSRVLIFVQIKARLTNVSTLVGPF